MQKVLPRKEKQQGKVQNSYMECQKKIGKFESRNEEIRDRHIGVGKLRWTS